MNKLKITMKLFLHSDPRLPVFERERQDRPENVDVQCGRGPIHGLIDERHAGL